MSRSQGNLNEESLMANFVAGSEKSFEVLIGKHSQALFSAALYLTNSLDLAEEILIEVFYRAYSELSWAEKKGGVRAWLYQLTVEIARDKLALSVEETTVVSAPEEIRENVLFDAKQLVSFSRELVLESLAALPHIEKTVFVLGDISGLSSNEIAAVLGSELSTVRAVQHAARRRIIQLIKRSPNAISGRKPQLSLTKLEPKAGSPVLHT